ncbi:methionyl aminopeptidase [Malassezia psittaci]|uniref:Methionine aminopeptidase n=1 Tax=Malassezia psittaci TaxID=1821823 RepID=A0AAF0FBP8_9BASI|nr:methionyl aminopeptidase [Malassezia psittaci]
MSEDFDPFAGVRRFHYSGDVHALYPLSPKSKIPPHIKRPNYGRESLFTSKKIKVNSSEEQEGVRLAAKLAREALEEIAALIRPGITTDEIDKKLVEASIKRECYPSPLGYHGYPKSVCTSVNEVICHGIPDRRKLKDGDLINLDVTLFHNGFHGDLNATYPVGERARTDEPLMRIIRTARECLDASIAICGPGMPYGEIGHVIEPIAERNGCAVVRNYTGHGIGRVFHGPPTVYHHVTKKSYGIMQPGHIFTIEPMVNLGDCGKDMEWPDNWTITTKDGALSAAAEETLLITDNGVEILTAKGGAKRLDTTEARERQMEARLARSSK